MVKKERKKTELPVEEIVKKWEQGDTQKELSKEYEVSEAIINNRISEYYAKERKEKPKRQSKTNQRISLPIEEIVEKWEQGTTQKELSNEYGVSQYIICKRISEYCEEKGKKKPPQRKIKLPIEEIVKKWEQGITKKELSKEYGTSEICISERICEYYEEKRDNEKKFKVLKSSSVIVEYLKKD